MHSNEKNQIISWIFDNKLKCFSLSIGKKNLRVIGHLAIKDGIKRWFVSNTKKRASTEENFEAQIWLIKFKMHYKFLGGVVKVKIYEVDTKIPL